MPRILRLREERKKRGLKATYVHTQLKIPGSTYRQYECGRRQPSISFLVSLSHLYNCTVDDLIDKDSIA